MPLKKSRTTRLPRVLAGAALALAALPGTAFAADCPVQSTTQAFSHLGDQNYYFLAPGGSFDSGPTWTRQGYDTSLVSVWDSSPLISGKGWRMESGGSITSPELCVDSTYPHLRLHVNAYRSSDLLKIEAIDAQTNVATPLAVIPGLGNTSWTASGYVPVASVLGLLSGNSRTVKLKVSSAQGDWKVDGVHIDPYMRG